MRAAQDPCTATSLAVHARRAAARGRGRDRATAPAPARRPPAACGAAGGSDRWPTPRWSARCADSPYAGTYRLARRLTAGAPTDVRRRRGRVQDHLRSGLHLQRAPADAGVPARGVPVRGQDRLLPAVLRCDGADAADGRHPRPRGLRLLAGLVQPRHRRVPGARPGRPLLGRGVLHRASAGSRSTPRRRRRRPIVPARARERPLGGDRPRRARANSGGGAAPRLRRRADSAAPERWRAAAGAAGRALADRGPGRRWRRRGGYRGRAPAPPARRRRGRRPPRRGCASSSARCRGWAGRCPPGTTLLELERSACARGGARRPPATWRGCARGASRPRAPRPPAARRAPRAAARAHGRPGACSAACAGSWRCPRAARFTVALKPGGLERSHEPELRSCPPVQLPRPACSAASSCSSWARC